MIPARSFGGYARLYESGSKPILARKVLIRTTARETFDDVLRAKRRHAAFREAPLVHRPAETGMPFEAYIIGDEPCVNFVGIRADENRIGYIGHKPNIKAVFPGRTASTTRAWCIAKAVPASVLTLYTEWGQDPIGCFSPAAAEDRMGASGLLSRTLRTSEGIRKAKPHQRSGLPWTDEPLAG